MSKFVYYCESTRVANDATRVPLDNKTTDAIHKLIYDKFPDWKNDELVIFLNNDFVDLSLMDSSKTNQDLCFLGENIRFNLSNCSLVIFGHDAVVSKNCILTMLVAELYDIPIIEMDEVKMRDTYNSTSIMQKFNMMKI
ncbi:MAG: hypothetical protein IKA36_05365 [Clostridia bacterium]|nr:hypothetical protein [Clostridia bacterium]